MRKFTEILFSAIIFGFVAFGTFFVFSELVIKQNTKFIENFQGAFVGAFFAFLFVRMADGLNKIYERHAKNNKALIAFEHQFNDMGGIIYDNIYTLDTFLDFVQKIETNPGFPILFSGSLHEIPINKDVILDLINLDFINDLASYNLRTRKMNDSLLTFNSAYQQIKTSFLEKQSNIATYVHNVLDLKDTAILFKVFLNQLLEDTTVIGAKGRLLNNDVSFFSRIVLLTFKKKYPKNFTQEVDKELRKLKAEIEQVGKESKERIDNIMSKGK